MKKIGIVLIILLAGFTVANDFRNVSWGATKAQVRASETFQELPSERDYALAFDGELLGLPVWVFYYFTNDDELALASYAFYQDYAADNSYIRDFENIEAILKDLYGDPVTEDMFWENDRYRDRPSEYGFAVSIGYLTYASSWLTETTSILHQMTGENFDVSHFVTYASRSLSDKYQEEQRQRRAVGF